MMTPQQLKNSILQRAIEGKLVEQRPEEGNAKELLKQIKAEKDKLIKEKKIKKSAPLSPISEDEIPFDVPESWEWVRLGEVCLSITDGDHQAPPKVSKGVPFLVISNVKEGNLDFTNTRFVPEEYYQKLAPERIAEFNDILFTVTGSYGIPVLVQTDKIFCFQRHIALLKVFKITDYLLWGLGTPLIKQYCDRVATGTAQKTVGLNSLREMIIPLPPLSEQKRIVAKIEKLMPLVEEYGKVYEELAALNEKFPADMKKSILQYAIEGKLVEQRPEEGTAADLLKQIKAEKAKLIKEGKIKKEKTLPPITEDEIPFDIPENWEWVRWGELSYSIQYGYNAPAQTSGRIKMVRISDIQSNKVLWDSVPYCEIEDNDIETYLLQSNDILFARTGGTVGKSYLVESVPGEAIYAGYLIRTRYSNMLVPKYLKAFMESDLYWAQLRTGTIATAQPNCNGKTLANMIVPLPPLSEQHRIVDRIEQLLPLCEKLM